MQRHLCRFLLINSLLSLFAFSFPAKGQDNIIAGLDTTGKTVLVKWFDNTVIFPYGVHIYRQESENIWERMTAKPFRKGDYPVPGHVLQEDSLMSAFIDMVRDARPSDLEGIAGAMVIVKAVENNDFARYLGICYYDENVVSGKRYRYRVMRLNAQGRETLLAESPFVEVGAYTPIAPPVGLDIKSGDSKVDIKWAPEPLRYFAVNIYRSSDRDPVPRKINPEPMMISERTDNTGKEGYPEIFFTDEPLSNYRQYTYFLKGIDYFGHESLPGEPFTIAPMDQTAPEPPHDVKLEADGMTIRLNWNLFNPSPDMEGFHVYRSARLSTGYRHVNESLLATNTMHYEDAVPEPGEYFYYIAAVDSAANEGMSFKEFIKVEDIYPPAAPRGVIARSDSGQIVLGWLSNKEKDLAGYQIFRTVQQDNPKAYVLLNQSPLKDTTFTDRLPFAAKNKFYYKVTAIDSSFNRSGYSDPVFKAMPDLVPPMRPLIKGTVQQEKSLLVEWVPNVEEDLKAYHIYRLSEEDSTGKQLNLRPVARTVSQFTDYQVHPGATYRYYITATDSADNVSLPSEYYFATFLPDIDTEGEPAENPLTDFRHSYRTGQKQVIIRWRVRDVPGYKGVILFRKEDAGFVPLTGLNKSQDYTDKEIKEGRQYTYRLHVFFDTGEVFKSKEIEVNIKSK